MRALAAAPRRVVAARPPPRAAFTRRAVARRPGLARAAPPPALPLQPDSDDDDRLTLASGSSAPLPSPSASSDESDALFPDAPPSASIALPRPRRSRLVAFTCNKCDARTERAVNPRAWDKGTVFMQCGECGAWHNLRDELNLIDEVVFPENAAAALAKAGPGNELRFAEEAALARATPPPEEGGRPARE